MHLFSAFIWAIAAYISIESLRHTTATGPGEIYVANEAELFPSVENGSRLVRRLQPELKSENINALVKELQSKGLGTSKEINAVVALHI